ncbi:hypothetical protein [Haloferax sp. KTX1]|uniref:hypothetical protein n=1 Tax=Haloferax sp. KTX1 TaxID=2600597 RepID=UPI0011DE1141|nr:hypothetical protein [Haloferax sp. KTX1]
MALVWYLDRALALVSYPALYLAVLTGILYNAEAFGPLRDAARRIHVEASVFAMMLVLAHGVVGLADVWTVLDGAAPVPDYGLPYLLAGSAVGVGALVVLVVAVLGFLDPRRFARPWSPRVVHAFAYAGFGFATVHAAAVGTDLAGFAVPGLVALVGFLAYVLALRALSHAAARVTAREA